MKRPLRILAFTLLAILNILPSSAKDEIPVLNRYVLAAIRTMPKGGGYEASQKAIDRLAQSVTLKGETIHQDLKAAKASFCSGATYMVFLRVIDQLQKNGSLKLSPKALALYANIGVQDGENVFGRWNANGPGTAKLFAELKCGTNFTSYDHARPGDFMKIWWNDEIGGKERGHSVVYLGMTGNTVRFWSSNIPDGYGQKTVAKSKIKRVLFSRLDRFDHLKRATKLSAKNRFLADMLRKPFTWPQVVKECHVKETP